MQQKYKFQPAYFTILVVIQTYDSIITSQGNTISKMNHKNKQILSSGKKIFKVLFKINTNIKTKHNKTLKIIQPNFIGIAVVNGLKTCLHSDFHTKKPF